jgi:hypothetical protein
MTSPSTMNLSSSVISLEDMRAKRALKGLLSPSACFVRVPQYRIRIAALWGRLTNHAVLKHLPEESVVVNTEQLKEIDSVGFARMVKELDDAFMAKED